VVTCSRDKSVRLFSGWSGSLLFTFQGHDNWVKGLDVHPTGKWLYTSSDDKTVRVWDLLTGKSLRRVEAH
jgi:platelet-activating factor acetylhydrolase IB subunit alpha